MKKITFVNLCLLVTLAIGSTGCTRWTVWNSGSRNDQSMIERDRAALEGSAGPMANQQSVMPASHVENAAPPSQGGADTDLKELDPSLAVARLSERHGDAAQAKKLYLAYIEKNPSHPLAYHRMGVVSAKAEKYQDADYYFQKALSVAQPSTQLLCDYAYALYLQDRLDQAEQLLKQAQSREPSSPQVCNNLGLVYGARGDFNQALAYFRRVNSEAKAQANLAFIYSQHGRLDQAHSTYLQALTHDNSLRNAAKALLQVDQARKVELAAAQTQQPAQPPSQGLPSDMRELGQHVQPPAQPHQVAMAAPRTEATKNDANMVAQYAQPAKPTVAQVNYDAAKNSLATSALMAVPDRQPVRQALYEKEQASFGQPATPASNEGLSAATYVSPTSNNYYEASITRTPAVTSEPINIKPQTPAAAANMANEVKSSFSSLSKAPPQPAQQATSQWSQVTPPEQPVAMSLSDGSSWGGSSYGKPASSAANTAPVRMGLSD